MNERANELIERLGLAPHPEGGHYREVFRSALAVRPGDGRDERSALTIIYFLLTAGQASRWHQVRSDEAWCWIEGAALELLRMDADARTFAAERLGAPGDGVEAVRVIAAGEWQAARTAGEYTLVSCAVGPGFDFADFRMLADVPEMAERVRGRWPDAAALV